MTRPFLGEGCQREVCPSDSVMTSSRRKVQAVALICICLLLLLLVIIWPVSFSDVQYYEVWEEVATEFAKGSQWGGNFNGGKQSNICSCLSYNQITVDIRNLKIWRRRRQRGHQKSSRFNIQNNNSARASHFFVHFFAVTAWLEDWKSANSLFQRRFRCRRRPPILRSLFCFLKRLTVSIFLLCERKSQERKRKGF